MPFFEKACRWLAAKMNVFGMVGIVFVAFLTCADIFSRIVYMPIVGVYDLVRMVTGFAIAFTVPNTIVVKGNVAVGLIVHLFSKRYQNIIETITLSFSLVFFGAIAWETIIGTITSRQHEECSLTLGVPMYYLIGLIAFALVIATLVLFNDLIHTIKKVREK